MAASARPYASGPMRMGRVAGGVWLPNLLVPGLANQCRAEHGTPAWMAASGCQSRCSEDR
jgi:hypothetical protein